VLLLSLATPAMLTAQAQQSLRGACFVFSYRPEAPKSDSTSFAKLVGFRMARNDHRLTSAGFANDSIHFWPEFEKDAHWTRIAADSLQLSFSNGYTVVTYNLGFRGDSLAGTATILFDFQDGGPMPRAHASGRRCQQSRSVPPN
jgi:hypothetical protein